MYHKVFEIHFIVETSLYLQGGWLVKTIFFASSVLNNFDVLCWETKL